VAEIRADLLSLLGDRVVVLHGPSSGDPDAELSGRDLDCGVRGLDPVWPLRLRDGWRLCQCLHYDLKAWYWVLERNGQMASLDALEDPRGLGRDGFPTILLDDEPPEATEGTRAAYLTAKRLRKGIRAEAEWLRIGRLAGQDPDRFLQALGAVIGSRWARRLSPSCLAGRPPDAALWRGARWRQRLRRVRTPARALTVLVLGARRQLWRVTRPTGLYVLVTGPDGSGKSTLAHDLPQLCGSAFRRKLRYHWRPEFLPRLGKLAGKGKLNPSQPHARPPYSRSASLLLLGYYWLDYLLGGWLRVWPFRMRSGLFVNERGWWDIAVDPRRYRLDVPASLVRRMGALLPRPDLALVLEAPAAVLKQRTSEITEAELERQLGAWQNTLPAGIRRVRLDASAQLDELRNQAREAVVGVLEGRATSRLGAGWTRLSPGGSSRWALPRGPRPVARAGLAVYHPTTARALLGWQAARLLASLGALRLLPRQDAPPPPVRAALAAHLPSGGTLAVARTTHRDRYVALIVDGRGTRRGIAKVAGDPGSAAALDREADAIATLGRLLPAPLAAPEILAHQPGLLLLEAVPWRPRLRPWELDEEVAWALGAFFRAGSDLARGRTGPAHGDCAPWNLLRTAHGWVLVDWEDATEAAPPFFDLFHYVVQAHAMLGRPSRRAVLEGFGDGRGRVGRAVRAYCDGAGLPMHQAVVDLAAYLREVESRLLPLAAGEHDGTPARQRLLQGLEELGA
jgi:hypothetical protein